MCPPLPSSWPITNTVLSPVRSLSSVGSQHETMGLRGYPARDFFAPSGTVVWAPVAGIVARLTGHDPKLGPVQGPHGPFGWSIYINGDDGHSYYMTHLATRTVKLNDYVRLHQVLGTVGNYAKYGTPSHVHMGIH